MRNDGLESPNVYLHQCFWIITSPLFEALTFRKPPKASKWWCCCNPEKGLWESLQSVWNRLYCQSISSKIALPGVPGAFWPMYFVIQSTRWSLNIPLMSWCRRSREISLYIQYLHGGDHLWITVEICKSDISARQMDKDGWELATSYLKITDDPIQAPQVSTSENLSNCICMVFWPWDSWNFEIILMWCTPVMSQKDLGQ